MKISAMIVATLAAIVAAIPASATIDETFGQISNLDESPNQSLRGLAASIVGQPCPKRLNRKCENGVGYICLRDKNGKLTWSQSGTCPK